MPEPTLTSTTVIWFPVVTAFGGFILAAISEYLRDRRATTRERDARNAVRHLQQLERRTNFQRQTLLDLQEAAQQLGRSCGTTYFIKHERFLQTGKWENEDLPLPDDLNEDLRQAVTKTIMLSARVRNDGVREMAGTFKRFATGIATASSKSDAQAALNQMMATLGPLHESIGGVLRKLDDDEEAAG